MRSQYEPVLVRELTSIAPLADQYWSYPQPVLLTSATSTGRKRE